MADLDVAVVGAGISGLVTAYRLSELGHEVEIFEARDVAGGRMRCGRIDGYVIDRGAETLAPYGYPATWEMIRELGLDRSGAVHRIRHPVALWRSGRSYAWMGHPFSLAGRAGLSWGGWVRMMRLLGPGMLRPGLIDPEWPEQSPYGTLTLTDMAERYSGEILDRMLEPISASAFGWLPERSCVAPLMAIILSTRGIIRWRTYRDGQDTMARVLAKRVKVHLSRGVTEIKNDGNEARLILADGTAVSARAVVVTLPSPQISEIYPDMPSDERAFVQASTFTTVMRVACMLDRPLEPRRRRFHPRLYAALLATGDNPLLVGCTVEHNKCPSRAPQGKGLISLLISPRRVPELFDAPDEEVVAAVIKEGGELIDGLREACMATDVIRWRHALPEAPPEAMRLRGAFVRRTPRAVEYAGDWIYLRPSSEAAIASARLAVPRVRAFLSC